MSLSQDDIRRIAKLARLKVADDALPALQQHLNSLFSLVDELNAIDTEGVAPMSHPQDIALRLREDAVTEANRREAYQAVAPQVEAGLYLVPKVIE